MNKIFKRISTYTIDEVFSLINHGVNWDDTRCKPEIILNRLKVKLRSDRYHTFITKGIICEDCGIKGSFFALEAHKEDIEKFNRAHFNLYAKNDKGEEILMTKDHIIPKSKGGKDHISNYRTLCCICNVKKSNTAKEIING
jgi:5-methylcytosine-specific restriction endonuclease McrA